ncbi:hypothetical protein [Geomonas sp. Red276]
MKLFADPARARSYLRTLGERFENPVEMAAFFAACDQAQAALVYAVAEELLPASDLQGRPQGELELELIKEELKLVLAKLLTRGSPPHE